MKKILLLILIFTLAIPQAASALRPMAISVPVNGDMALKEITKIYPHLLNAKGIVVLHNRSLELVQNKASGMIHNSRGTHLTRQLLETLCKRAVTQFLPHNSEFKHVAQQMGLDDNVIFTKFFGRNGVLDYEFAYESAADGNCLVVCTGDSASEMQAIKKINGIALGIISPEATDKVGKFYKLKDSGADYIIIGNGLEEAQAIDDYFFDPNYRNLGVVAPKPEVLSVGIAVADIVYKESYNSPWPNTFANAAGENIARDTTDCGLIEVDATWIDRAMSALLVNNVGTSNRHGGLSRTTSAILTLLGARPRVVIPVGEDSDGSGFIRALESDGADVTGVVTVKKAATARNLIRNLEVEDNRSTKDFALDLGACIGFDFRNHLTDEDFDVSIFHFGGIELTASSVDDAKRLAEDVLWALKKAKRHGATTVIDTVGAINPAYSFWQYAPDEIYKYIDFMKPGWGEAQAIWPDHAGTEEALVQHLLDKGVGAVALTMDDKGCLIESNEKSPFGKVALTRIPIYPAKEFVDGTGCGDGFTAGMIFGILNGWDMETTARFASAIGSLVVEETGGTLGKAGGALGVPRRVADVFERMKLSRNINPKQLSMEKVKRMNMNILKRLAAEGESIFFNGIASLYAYNALAGENITPEEVFTNPETQAKVTAFISELFNLEVVTHFMDTESELSAIAEVLQIPNSWSIAEGSHTPHLQPQAFMGGLIYNGFEWAGECPVGKFNSPENLPMPDLKNNVHSAMSYNTLRQLKGMLPSEKKLMSTALSPLDMLNSMIGHENTIMLFLNNEDLVNKLLKYTTKIALEHVDNQIDAGADIICFLAPDFNVGTFSPAICKKVVPYLNTVVEAANARGVPVIIHSCGMLNEDLLKMLQEQVTAQGYSYGEATDLHIATQLLPKGSGATLLGGVESKDLQSVTAEEVRARVESAANTAKEINSIIAPSCDIPYNTPPEILIGFLELMNGGRLDLSGVMSQGEVMLKPVTNALREFLISEAIASAV